MSRQRIAVLSDLHANVRALRACIARAREVGFDRLIVLGDLLTYGLDVDEVLDLVDGLVTRDGATLVAGNHDQLYFDLERGDGAYLANLPDWLKESVAHTRAQLASNGLERRYAWAEEHRAGRLYVAHANPFGYRDWTYLNGPPELERAFVALSTMGAGVGVFGHNHRPAVRSRDPLGVSAECEGAEVPASRVALVNPGSVGQPRSGDPRASFAVLELDELGGRFTIERVDYDVAGHVAALMASPLREATRAKLAGFFSPSA